MRALAPSGSRRMSIPSMRAVPDVGVSSPHSLRNVVVLPAPLAPRKPKISPRSTAKLTPLTALTTPYRLTSCLASTAVDSPAALEVTVCTLPEVAAELRRITRAQRIGVTQKPIVQAAGAARLSMGD